MPQFSESVVEEAARAWLRCLRCAVLHRPESGAYMLSAKRSDPWHTIDQVTTEPAPL